MFWGKLKEITKVIREVDVQDIVVPDGRIRQVAYDENLRALSESIREHGILEPLLVRKDLVPASDVPVFHLIAGERRLRAAEMAGLDTVPCVSIEANEVDAAVIAIIENLHREDLNIFEEAAAIASLIELSGMTQEQCARRLAVSQSYIANKLRLLRFSKEERELLLKNGLTERHARTLLRLSEPEERLRVMKIFIERGMNVAAAEEYIESLLCAESRAEEIRSKPPKSEQRHKLIIKDIRIFYNSIDHAVDIIKKSGIPVESTRKETDHGTLISILLPKAM
ncbi:MAG: ParB/RepB/Spo0J family partition protein [Clostridia bacterium]|nr:ParB/RepB/Spo0J family partition protein [Clostridia bacterium]